jgi:hypothetical protein
MEDTEIIIEVAPKAKKLAEHMQSREKLPYLERISGSLRNIWR